MKLGLFQYSPVWEDKKENKNKILDILSKGNYQTDLLIFPEMTLTGFSMKSKELAENLDGESFIFFKNLAIEKDTNVITGLIFREVDKIFNTAVHFNSKGEIKSIYKKIHPFSPSTEDKNYEVGSQTQVTKIDNWKIGLSICYDLRFPELYRFYAKQRTELIIVIANWPVDRIAHWRQLLKARAIENQCYVTGVNRVGDTGKLKYNGWSSVYNPMGKEIVGIENDEGLFITEINIDEVKQVQNNLPFLDDIKLI